MRYGIDGKLIDFGKQAEVPMRDLAIELLEFIDDVVDDLGSRKAVEYVHTILEQGSSADRQVRAYRERGGLTGVVDHLCEESMASLQVPTQPETTQQPARD
jgi:carboxylate-amine ligase